MTTNRDRAVEVMRSFWHDGRYAVGFDEIVEALDDDGLLTDDDLLAQIERVREALHRIEQADEQAQHDWDTKADMLAQGAAMGYSMSAQWLEEALGDADD